MQIPLISGRDVEERDRSGSQQVAVINEEFAKVNFPGQNPLGRHVMLWEGVEEKKLLRDMEVIGVASNARYGDLKRESPPPLVYIPYNQGSPQPNGMMFALRTQSDPAAFVQAAREAVHQADAILPVSDIRTQKAEIADILHQEIIAGAALLGVRRAGPDDRLCRVIRHGVVHSLKAYRGDRDSYGSGCTARARPLDDPSRSAHLGVPGPGDQPADCASGIEVPLVLPVPDEI